ncbi:MAG: hypothetical protein JWN99_831 [Ilumatobacteraceae bacterium]|nr:hypothetical protein [Ilumatobacteraceae bacterium]
MNTAFVHGRWMLAALLIAGAALFAIGVAAERANDHHGSETTEHSESGLVSHLESIPLVVTGCIASLLLALAVVRRQDRRLLLLITGFAVAFTLLDVTEVVHQINDHQIAIGLLAAAVAIVHGAAAGLTATAIPRT